MKEIIVVAAAAEDEFNNWADAMCLDISTEGMDTEDLTAFNKQKRRVLQAVMHGNLVFSDEGEAVYTPFRKKSKSHDPITFGERDGASLMAMDGKKKNSEIAKTYAIMGAMCGVPAKTFAGLAGEDLAVCMAIFALLMD